MMTPKNVEERSLAAEHICQLSPWAEDVAADPFFIQRNARVMRGAECLDIDLERDPITQEFYVRWREHFADGGERVHAITRDEARALLLEYWFGSSVTFSLDQNAIADDPLLLRAEVSRFGEIDFEVIKTGENRFYLRWDEPRSALDDGEPDDDDYSGWQSRARRDDAEPLQQFYELTRDEARHVVFQYLMPSGVSDLFEWD